MTKRRILFLQFGDFAEAWHRLSNGGDDTYRDQARSVFAVSGLAPENSVSIIGLCDRCYDETLMPGLSVHGLTRKKLTRRVLRKLFDVTDPDLLVCRTPNLAALSLAQKRGVPTLPSFADIFAWGGGPRTRLSTWQLARTLRGDAFNVVANHSLNASRSMADVLGIARDRIIPWDWSRVPLDGAPKTGLAEPGKLRILYAGLMIPEKGVGDAISAVAQLRAENHDVELTCVGSGDTAAWSEIAAKLNIAEAVHTPGAVSHATVRREMRAHDVVVVPSRHSYAEGLPNTIYEALAAHTPLVLSDHPAFRARLTPEQDCLQVSASDPTALAAAFRRLKEDPALYARLSANAPDGLDGLYVGMEWSHLLAAFLADPRGETGWYRDHTLAALDR